MKEKYSERVTVRLTETMHEELEHFSEVYNISKNSIIRQAITSWLNSASSKPQKMIAKPVSVPVRKTDDPFSDSLYNW